MSPLARRLPRELRHNVGKYLGLFVLIALTICVASGFLVAARSIQRLVAEQRAASHMEDFSLTTRFEAPEEALRAIESTGTGSTVYENFQSDVSLAVGAAGDKTVRLYQNRSVVNTPTFYEGHAPQNADQIALDRTFCATNGVALGDTVEVAGRPLSVCGLMVLPDYQALMRTNTSFIYDVTNFCVALVTPQAFDQLSAGQVAYRYAVVLNDAAMTLPDRTTYEHDVAKALQEQGVPLDDLVDKDAMASRTYADDDLEADQSVWFTLCAVLIVVSAFVFVVLTNATVESESAMIGTLMASGYRTGELVRHYLALPLAVGLAASVVGNAVGYGLMARGMSGLYYTGYSFPPFRAFFSPGVFVLTTVVPLVLLFAITLVGVSRKLGAPPLAFLRREVGRRARRRTLALPERWGFLARFRTRVFVRNASHFAVLFVGIMFSSLLILFCVCLYPLMDHYSREMAENLPVRHLYVLKAPLELEAADAAQAAGHPLNALHNSEDALRQAEKVSLASFEVPRLAAGAGNEEVTVYGIEVGSSHWSKDVSGGKILVGRGLAEKCGLALGETFALTNRYTSKSYAIIPDALAGTRSDMAVYMSRATWAELFAQGEAAGDEAYFNAYASDDALAIEAPYLAYETNPQTMAEIANQMMDTFGGMLDAVTLLAVGISVTLIYLLTKTAIERSARYISYMKVFGYHSREIDRLYVRPITYTVVASFVLSLPLVIWLVSVLMRGMMARFSGNLYLWFAPEVLVKTLAIGLSSYVVVAVLHVLRVRRISLSEAMKVQE